MQRLMRAIDPKDLELLVSAFETRKTKLELTSNELAEAAIHAIYWDWRQSRHPFEGRFHGGSEHHYSKAFNDYVEVETHYEMIRRGFEWDEGNGRFKGNGTVSHAYPRVRTQIIQAIAPRIIEFLESQKELFDGRAAMTDCIGVRVPLERYIN